MSFFTIRDAIERGSARLESSEVILDSRIAAGRSPAANGQSDKERKLAHNAPSIRYTATIGFN